MGDLKETQRKLVLALGEGENARSAGQSPETGVQVATSTQRKVAFLTQQGWEISDPLGMEGAIELLDLALPQAT